MTEETQSPQNTTTEEKEYQEVLKDLATQLDLDPELVKAFDEAMENGTPMYSVLGIDETELQNRYTLARQFYESGKLEDAKNQFGMLCLLSDNAPANWMGLGACNMELGNYDDAINAYTMAVIHSEMEDAEPVYRMGICHLRKGDKEKAKLAFQKCLGFGNQDDARQKEFFDRSMTILSTLDDEGE
ncbi:MAG: tetratricopeptide repeat protein [Desulfovibrio sp.]|nr:tetratricopeptide repeat protein [Desulfovibrio sp.]